MKKKSIIFLLVTLLKGNCSKNSTIKSMDVTQFAKKVEAEKATRKTKKTDSKVAKDIITELKQKNQNPSATLVENILAIIEQYQEEDDITDPDKERIAAYAAWNILHDNNQTEEEIEDVVDNIRKIPNNPGTPKANGFTDFVNRYSSYILFITCGFSFIAAVCAMCSFFKKNPQNNNNQNYPHTSMRTGGVVYDPNL